MIKLTELEQLIEVTLFTGSIKDGRPVSLIFIAEPESGKTEPVKKAQRVKGVLYLTDATAWGIVDKYWDKIEKRVVCHIIIPDLTVPLGKQTETRKAFTRFLSALIEEGVVELQSYAVQKTAKVEDLRCGLITTITPAALRDQRGGWRKFGFMSRLLPVSYSYSQGTIREIFQSILRHQYRREQPFATKLPDQDLEVHLPENFAGKIQSYAIIFGQAQQLYGFRLQKQLQTLMMGSALYHGRDEVNQEDFDFVRNTVLDYFGRFLGLNMATNCSFLNSNS